MGSVTGKQLIRELNGRLRALGSEHDAQWYAQQAEEQYQKASAAGASEKELENCFNAVDTIVFEISRAIIRAAPLQPEEKLLLELGLASRIPFLEQKRNLLDVTEPLLPRDVAKIRRAIAALRIENL